MTRSLRSGLLAAALLIVPAAAAPAAHAASHSQTASSGAVSATVTWQKTTRDGGPTNGRYLKKLRGYLKRYGYVG